jgi:hypothetical protein
MQGAVRGYDLARGGDQPTPDWSVPDLVQFVEVVGDLTAVNRPARAPNHFGLQLSRTPTVGERAIAEVRAGGRAVSVLFLHLQQALGALLFSADTTMIANDESEITPSWNTGPDRATRNVRFFVGDRIAALPGSSQYTLSPDVLVGPFHLEPGEILAVSSIGVTNALTVSLQVVEYAS